MPNSLIHYAAGALLAHGAGLRGRARALVPLVAVVPDLDVVTAVPWMVLAPHLPWGADALITGGWILGHRGLSHTFLAAVLCGIAVWLWRRDTRLAAIAGGIWASHVVLDIVTPWPTAPWWPISTVELQQPLVTTLDPVLTLASLAVVLALVAPVVLPRLPWPGQARRDRWIEGAQTRQGASLVAVSVAFVVVLGTVPVTALALGAPLADVHPSGSPGTVVVDRVGDAYTLSFIAQPWVDEPHQTIPVVRGDASSVADQRVALARCVLENLGPYGTVDLPAFVVEARPDGTSVVRAYDVIRNATQDGGPELRFVIDDGQVVQATTGGAGDDGPRFELALPQAVVEAAPCP